MRSRIGRITPFATAVLVLSAVHCSQGTSSVESSSAAIDSAYSLAVSAPSNDAKVGGTVTVTGSAPGFLNVEVWDPTHKSPPLARVTPEADGSFATTVTTTALANGSDAWTVWAWDSPPGAASHHSASVPVAVTVTNYTLAVTAPAKDATLSGTVTVTGNAPGFVNVEIWDSTHQSPPLARVTPKPDGSFETTVNTTTLANGSDPWTVWAWDSPPGATAKHSESEAIALTIANLVTLPKYTLVVTAPAKDAKVSGTVTVTGSAPGFLNVEVWDPTHQSPPLARVTPKADGSFSASVTTTALANGDDAWTVWAWDSPPGVAANHTASEPLPVDVSNVSHADAGSPVGTNGLDYLVGYKLGTSVNGASAVQSWLGRPLDVVGTTINTEGNIADSPFYTVGGNLPLMETSFPLLSIFGEGNGLNDMAQAANGAYDGTYTAMAQKLAAWPNPLLSVRIAWELNGNWYPWSNGAGTNATYANYVAAFKRAAAIVKQQNPNVLIQWCLAWGQPDPTPYWPGAYDAVSNPGGVDVISMDFYQADITQYNNGGNTSSWALAQSGVTIDLDWMVSFAQDHGVKIALSEYAAGKPGGQGLFSGPGLDDGVWTAASITWMNSLPAGLLLWEDWSDDYPADDLSSATANPNEAEAWRSAWADTHFAGTWWHGPPPPKN